MMTRYTLVRIVAAATLLAGACTPAANTAAQESSAGSSRAPLTASGGPTQIAPEADTDNLEWAASVVRVDYLQNQDGGGSKLFGTAGGDPAMNGLYTYLAFFGGPAEGWREFRLGDFLDYRVLNDFPGRVDLELQESTMNSDGMIGSRTRNVIVTWTLGEHGAPPDAISVTPAQ